MTIRGKKIYRSTQDRRVAGVCGGCGDFFDIDPVLVRLVWIVVTCFSGVIPGVVAYLAAWLLVPEEPVVVYQQAPQEEPGS